MVVPEVVEPYAACSRSYPGISCFVDDLALGASGSVYNRGFAMGEVRGKQGKLWKGRGCSGSPGSWSKGAVCLPAPLLLCAVAVLVAVYSALALYVTLPSARGLLPGSRSYGLLAADIVSGGTFSSTYRPPLYPLFLAAAMCAAPDWSGVALILQGLMAVSLGVFIVWLAWAISHNVIAGVLALALFASHVPLHLEMLSERETALFCLLSTGFVSVWAIGRRMPLCHVFMAVLTALLYLTRPTGVLFASLLCVLLLLDRGSTPLRFVMLRLISCLGIVALLVLPWQLFVSHKIGEFRFSVSTTSGVNLLKGNNPDLESFFPMVDVDLYEPFIREMAAERQLTGAGADAELGRIALGNILNHPTRALGRCAIKALLLFSPLPIPLGKGELQRVDGQIQVVRFVWRNKLLCILGICHASLLCCGVLACIRRDHSTPARRFLLGTVLVCVLFAMVHAVTFPETRFRLPLDVLIIAPAALGYARLVEPWRRAARNVLIKAAPAPQS